uniref:Fucosyltransferase n=1 Tax=Rhabditophanes sp. KR3021 TaxID=114890 RepID=A0AC35TVA8_9BILA
MLQWTRYSPKWQRDFHIRCPAVADCVYTEDRSKITVANAVIFVGQFFNNTDIPRYRNKNQLYVYQNLDPFSKYSHPNSINRNKLNFFNLTSSLSNESDLPKHYGQWFQIRNQSKYQDLYFDKFYTDSFQIMYHKKKPILWDYNGKHSHSNYEKALNLVRKEIAIEEMANVLPSSLKHFPDSVQYKSIYNNYYFYIASEDVDCTDFISDVYWKRAHFNSVPIVSARLIYERRLPPYSFVAMDDFKSASDLVVYLKHLMNNQKDYLKYFEYRKHGWKLWNLDQGVAGYCGMCLQLKQKLFIQKTYKNVLENLGANLMCLPSNYILNKWKHSLHLKSNKLKRKFITNITMQTSLADTAVTQIKQMLTKNPDKEELILTKGMNLIKQSTDNHLLLSFKTKPKYFIKDKIAKNVDIINFKEGHHKKRLDEQLNVNRSMLEKVNQTKKENLEFKNGSNH